MAQFAMQLRRHGSMITRRSVMSHQQTVQRPTHLVAEYFSPFVTGQLPCMDVKSVSLPVQRTRLS